MADEPAPNDPQQASWNWSDDDTRAVQLWRDSWTRARYYAVRRAPYYAPYILRLKPEFVPNGGQMRIRKDWRCVVDPTLLDEDYLWKLLVYWSHHLYQDHLGRRAERHPAIWSIACQLATVEAWGGVMTREDTEAEYPGVGLPPGLMTAEDFGLEPSQSVEEYYQALYDSAQVVPIPGPGDADGGPGNASAVQNPAQQSSKGDGATGAPGAGDGGKAGPEPRATSSPEQAPQGSDVPPPPEGGANGASPDGEERPGTGDASQATAPEGDTTSRQETPETPAPRAGRDMTAGTQPEEKLEAPNPIDLEHSEAPEDEREVEVLHEVASQIARATEGGLSAGNSPGDMLRELAPKPGYRAPIERRLSRLVTRKKGNQDWQMSHRPSTRDLNHPDGVISASLTKGLPEVVFLIDTSGSMSEEMLAGALEVAERVCRSATIRVATGDVIVQDLERKDLSRAGIRRLAAQGLRGGGGTDMVRCITEVSRKAPGMPILVFTDGIFRWPQAKEDLGGARAMWLIIEHPHYPPAIPDWCLKDVVEVSHAELGARMGISV